VTRVHTRRRDSARSKRELLDAAAALFTEQGFDRTTVREIGERAGIDPALIARYFGGKVGLYVETLRSSAEAGVPDILQPGRLGEVLDKVRGAGTSPIMQAAVRSHDDPAVQNAARATIATRLTDPLAARMEQAGLPHARLRAELAVAALAGVALGRTSGVFADLSAASDADVVELTTKVLGALLDH
jgi:AcrR family transcriptional regulator